ncbi:MAG: hypothetical protein AB7F50_09220 [Fimbriimonadaceae bacterium]
MKDKKTLVLVALGVVLVAVGAFGFLKPEPKITPKVVDTLEPAGSPKADPQAASAAKEPGNDERAEQLMALVTGPLQPRDPFELQGSLQAVEVATPPTTNTPPVAGNIPPPTRRTSPVPPLEPVPGNLSGPVGGIGVSPGAPIRQPSELGYRVKGVVVGAKPVVVLEDDNGNQRLVPAGVSIDGDSKVVSVSKGRVTIQHKGKQKTYTVSEGQ